MAELQVGRASGMIAGHFGFAALVKGREQRVPLWTLMLATVWLDVVFVPLLLAGIETLEPVPGTRGGYGANIIHADYTHSLLGAAVLSAILGAIGLACWGKRAGIVLGAVAFSHWLLDLPVHRADMPVFPGNLGHLPKLGFGLWRVPWVVVTLEFALVAIGSLVYWRAAHSVAAAAGSGVRRAAVAGALILGGGAAVLAMDVTGILG